MDGEFGIAYVARGILQTLQGAEALNAGLMDLLAATERMPDCSYAWAGLGFHWIVTKTPEEACKCYTKSLELDPTFGEAWIGRACACLATGRFEEALHDLEQASQANPEWVDLCSRNRSRLLAVVNRFLHNIRQYSGGALPGKTLAMRFKVNELVVDGKVIPVYVFGPSCEYDKTLEVMREIANDLSERWREPIEKLNIHVHAHGWGSSGFEHMSLAARFAASGNKDAALVPDLPILRGNTSGIVTNAIQPLGRQVATLNWREFTNLAGTQVGCTGLAINEVFGNRGSFSGIDGGAEAFLKQGELEQLEGPYWNQVILAGIAPYRATEMPDSVAENTDRIVNFYTRFGAWSALLSDQSKITNIELTPGGKAIPHAAWTGNRLKGGRNPVVVLGGAVLQNTPVTSLQEIANIINKPHQLGKGAEWLNEGEHSLSTLDMEKTDRSRPRDMLYSAKPGDIIVRHGKGGILGPTLSVGYLTGGKLNDITHVGIYVGDQGDYNVIELQIEKVGGKSHGIIRTTTWDNEERFKNAAFFSILNSNIPVSNDAEIKGIRELRASIEADLRDRLVRRAKSFLNRDLGEYSIFGDNHCGSWVINDVYDPVLKGAGVQVMRTKGLRHGEWYQHREDLVEGSLKTWFSSPLFGNSFVDPSYANDACPRVAEPGLLRTEPLPSHEESLCAATLWHNIGATSFGRGGRLADVWHRDFKNGININQMISDTMAQARRTGATDVTLVHDLVSSGLTRKIADRLKAEGLSVHTIRDDRLSKVTTVGGTMGYALTNQHKSAISWTIFGKETAGIDNTSNSDISELIYPPAGGAPTSLSFERLLFSEKDDLSRIIPLVNNIASREKLGKMAVLGTDDLRSAVVTLQFYDAGYDVLRALPNAELLESISKENRFDAIVVVQPPKEIAIGGLMDKEKSNVKIPNPHRRIIPGHTSDDNLTPPDMPGPPHKNWNVIEDALKRIEFKYYKPPETIKLPGGVSTKEFARVWVDDSDWPFWVSAPGSYSTPIILTKP